MVKEINQDQFEQEVIQTGQAAVLDFFSTDCPPCEALAPKYEAVEQSFGDRVKFLKIYRQGNRDLAEKLGVSGSPTLVFFKDGQEQGQRLSGEIKKSEIKGAIEQLVGE